MCEAFVFSFILYAFFHYTFFVIVYHLPPGTYWHILSTNLLKDAIEWSFLSLINFLFLRLIIEFLHQCKVTRVTYIVVFVFLFCVYVLFFWIILGFWISLTEPFAVKILNLIPEIYY